MLEAIGLHKRYGDLVAVHEATFRAEPGQIVGLLGPNGAGKSTTVAMIAGILKPDRGEVRINGSLIRGETDPVKRSIGLVPQELALHGELSAHDNLELFGSFYGLLGASLHNAMQAALELTGLADRTNDRVSTFSGGMMRRLNLAAALLHDPDILLLDEPTVGVDPQSRNAIFTNLETLKSRGKTLIYTTHYMEEAERLCDRIVIIDHGNVIANDRLEAVRRLAPAVNVMIVELSASGDDGWCDSLRRLDGVESAELNGSSLRVAMQDLTDTAPRVLAFLRQYDLRYTHVATERADLETVFLTLTGRSVRNA